MSKLRDEEALKKKLAQEDEKIFAMAKDGKEGVKNTQVILKEEQEVEKKKEDKRLEILTTAAHSLIFTYTHTIAKMLIGRLRQNSWPRGWSFQTAPTDKGVILELYSPDGRIFRSAFSVTKQALYDLNAIETFGLRAEETVSNYDRRPGRPHPEDIRSQSHPQ